MQIAKTPKKELSVRIASVNKQAGYDDCGIFAAAYSTSLANDQDPSACVYQQDAMRAHLAKCLERKQIKCFPEKYKMVTLASSKSVIADLQTMALQ